jgi:hypothetical protein
MDKKIPALVVLAAFTTEAILSEHHHDATHSQPHTENDAKPPKDIPVAMMSGGTGRAVSATLALTPEKDRLAAQPHIEPIGGAGPAATGIDLNQIS